MPSRRSIAGAFLTGDRAPIAVSAAGYIALAGTLWPSTAALIAGIKSRSIFDVAAWAAYILVIGIWFGRTLIRRTPDLLPASEKFEPFADLDSLRIWRRDKIVETLISRLQDNRRARRDNGSDAQLCVVVGPSGAGKTVILRKLLPEALGISPDLYCYIDDYAELVIGVERELQPYTDLNTDNRRILVLDQFEQFVATINTLSRYEQTEKWAALVGIIDGAVSNGFDVIVSIRYEWYYQLRPLAQRIPRPSECIYISGPESTDRSDQTLAAFSGQLSAILRPDLAVTQEVVNALGAGGSILLLEAQIVGSTLESIHNASTAIDVEYFRQELGGVDGAIDVFFDQILRGARDRRIALKVLAALSTTTQFRTQQDTALILDVLYEDDEKAREALRYLETRGLVVQRGGWGQVELAHDYVADYFHSRCGHELRPVDRDNVVYHLEAGRNHSGRAVLSRARRATRHGTFGWTLLTALLVLMVVRLLGFGLHWTVVGNLKPRYVTKGKLLDETYVPVFLAHGAWAIYITLFYVRLLDMLDERGFAKLLSRMVPTFMVCCVVVAMFIPYAWMFSIGCGGLFLGIKLLTFAFNTQIGSGARNRMLEFGRTTTAALGILTALGAGGLWVSFALQNHALFQSRWTDVSVFAAITMTIPCLALAPYHIQRPAVAEFLGLLARSPKSFVDRASSGGMG